MTGIEDLKTITLDSIGNEDDPCVSLCPGHVDCETFFKAFEREDAGLDRLAMANAELNHAYWKLDRDSWEPCDKDEPGSVAMTEMWW